MFTLIDRFGELLNRLKISKRIIAGIIIGLFLLSLIPIIITMFYSVPVLDDYNFGYWSHKSIVDGDSFIGGIIKSNNEFFMTWQGF